MVSQANINDGKQLEEMSRQLYKLLDKKPVFMCIGTEKVCSDSLGPLVGHGHGGLVGFDGAEGVVRGFGVLRLGQRIEQSGLAHVGQADDT